MGGEALSVRHLCKSYAIGGKRIQVLNNICLDVKRGEFITIVGHSGCGKTTLLKLIAGLIDYGEGEILRNSSKITEPGAGCGVVFQDHRLMPWLRVKDNVGFGLRKMKRDERARLVRQYLRLVNLEGFADAWPHQLSGGMSQRAAIARSLVTKPDILLLDEPFSALDALTRIQMQKEIKRIWLREKTTMILVTHDIDEAVFLGERVIVMSEKPGEIREIIPVPGEVREERGSAAFAIYKDRVCNFFSDNL